MIILLLSFLLFSGCMIGPDYERPFISEPKEFLNQPTEVLDTNSLAETPWWDLFQDEELMLTCF